GANPPRGIEMTFRALGRSLPGTILVATLALAPASLFAQSTPSLVAPPRSTGDITSILDRQKPDPGKRAKIEADAEAAPPTGKQGLSQFYFRRCQARADLGRALDAIGDCEKAAAAGGDDDEGYRIQQRLESLYRQVGDYKHSTQLLQDMEKRAIPNNRGRLMN